MPAMLVVSDLRASIRFYSEVVGLQLVDRTASAAAILQDLVHVEDDELRGAGGPGGMLIERGGAGPTRDELQRLDWSVMAGGDEGDIEAIQAATLRHADGTWLRLLQLGAAFDGRHRRQATAREKASSVEQRTSNTAGAMDSAAGAADLGAAAVMASGSAAQLALAAVVACEAVLEAATEAGTESEGSPLAMATINYAAAAQQAAALCAEASTAAELAALNASNAAALSTNYSAETSSWQATDAAGPSTPINGGAGVALCFFVSEPELDALVERLVELETLPWEESPRFRVVDENESEKILGS
jgi:catechol 2,3-dioxygenase-like lactoylglutathione lyase family enzyme